MILIHDCKNNTAVTYKNINDFPFRGSINLPISQRVLEAQSCFPSNPPNMNVIALLRVSLSFGITPTLPCNTR